MDILIGSMIMAGLVIGIGTICPAISQGLAVASAMNGISRQPEAAGALGTNLIIGLAFMESLTIYALVVALLLLFANPYAKSAKDVAEAKSQVDIVKLEIEKLQLQQQLDSLKQEAPAPAR